MPCGVYERKPGMRNTKLTSEQRDTIKLLAGDRNNADLDRKLGEMFGVSRFCVVAIRRGWWRRGYPVGGSQAITTVLPTVQAQGFAAEAGAEVSNPSGSAGA